jgi:hypothetical protein
MLAVKELAIFLLALSTLTEAADVNDDEESAKRLQQMYRVIHNVALPKPLHGGRTTKRLIMMLPGIVLSERDYHPGAEYITSYSQTDADKYLEIPPIKMQNLFNLVDVIPGIDPLRGQESGESFSRTYKNILGRMDIKGVDKIAQDQRVRQQQSVDFLTEIPERSQDECDNLPENACIKTRWDIYRYYEKKYNEKKKAMEEKIDFERNNRTALEYQYWFIRSYPSLQAEVDGAFMDWLVKGDKDIVELYRSRLDTSSVGTLLLEAKSALRASGFTALDRSKTVYPVNFIPGDWYRFLRDPDLKLTPDQINMQIAYLEARKNILTAMNGTGCDVSGSKSTATTTNTNDNTAVTDKTEALMTKRCECGKSGGKGDKCTEYLEELSSLSTAADASAYSYMALQGLDGLAGDTAAIDEEITRVDNSIAALTSEGGATGYGLPGLATLPLGPQPSPTDNWLAFDYNSNTKDERITKEKTSTSFSLSFKASFGLWSVSGGFSHSKQTEDNFRSFKSRDVKVAGELLRVSVQYPWFRPELFKEPKLTMTENIRVSPGPGANDEEYTTTVNDAVNDNPYHLPQYVTGILLCRNLVLEFGGVDQTSSYKFVATSLSTSLSVGYGPFSLSTSYSRSSQKSSFQASSTATGLRISVPGVQMIGYYTEVPPKFPVDD